MKLHIFYDFKDGPWGGGNQFLKALRGALAAKGAYSENPEDADAVLFNSHHFGENDAGLERLYALKVRRPGTVFLHRIDGPVKLIRGRGGWTDRAIFTANRLYADATVFQTRWSKERSMALGYKPKEPVTTILNTPDRTVFYPGAPRPRRDRLRLIATSWAANKRKGFDIYHFLDENLDFSRYEMMFVGNIIRPFKHIRHIPPCDSAALAEHLRAADVYVTASRNDPCSNALCEGLACGLPALALNSGGHPEIVGKGGATFEGPDDVLERLEALRENYDSLKSAIALPCLDDIAQSYLDFTRKCQPGTIGANSGRAVKRALCLSRMADRFYGFADRVCRC